MTRHESIRYIHLRAEECGFSVEILDIVRKKLETLLEEELESLKRISESEFRTWCTELKE